MKLWRYGLALERLGDRYRLDGVLGSGGMADVCLAWDEREQHEVAVKVIKSNELDQRSLNRFLKEASQVARWRHPHILRIYGDARLELVDTLQGSIVPYIVMEYAPNGDLQHRLRPGEPFPFAETLALFAQLCDAVAYAHGQGVIHRDLKPHNILFRTLPDGAEQVALSDFGLAVEIHATHFTFAAGGTLPYMAPEQLQGRAQMSSDIFALGVILYQLCTGQLPFKRTLQDLRRRGPQQSPPLPSALYKVLPPELDNVILTALAEDPELRYPDAWAFWDEINAVVDAETIAYISQHESLQQSLRSHTNRPSRYTSSVAPLAQSDEQPDVLVARRRNPHLATSGRGSFVAPASQQSRSRVSTGLPTHTAPHTSSRIASRVPPAPVPSTSQHGRVRTHSSSSSGLKRLPIILLIALAFAVLGVTIVGVWTPLGTLFHHDTSAQAAQATVTLTLASKTISNDYTFATLNDQPSNINQNQIAIHTVTAQSRSQTQTVQGTGHTHTQGASAQGILTFFNGKFVTQTILQGTVLSGKDGVQAVSDMTINLPPVDNNGKLGTGTVTAHVVNPGVKGDIVALDINQTCCSTDTIFVKNTAPFTGGVDPKDYMFVQQSDVDAVLSANKVGQGQQARNAMNGQVVAGQQLLGQSVQCSSKADASQPVGDKGQNIAATQVTVTSSCHGTSYDQGTLQQAVSARMQTLAAQEAGPGYILAGKLQPGVALQTSQTNGALVLVVHASGIWVYQLSPAQKHTLVQKIAGQTIDQARAILADQIGVQNVFITIGSGNKGQLPADAGQIAIQVQSAATAR
ncbi:serine/threonine protein kinase [Ktedonobacteria bacterium brp13]|nr:serine/threonine protein kinase [Ktedonobacteria bacterium brp13]